MINKDIRMREFIIGARYEALDSLPTFCGIYTVQVTGIKERGALKGYPIVRLWHRHPKKYEDFTVDPRHLGKYMGNVSKVYPPRAVRRGSDET